MMAEEELLMKEITELVRDNITRVQNQREYKEKYDAIIEKREAMRSGQSDVRNQIAEKA